MVKLRSTPLQVPPEDRNDEKDSELARELSDDPKENSEHVMLVDLARNDLSRHGTM